jgi:hypothetical protein
VQRLFTTLLVKKPENPYEFLIAQAKSLQGHGASLPPLYTEDDCRGMFSLMDPTNQMHITVQQARVALRNLGLNPDAAAAWGLPASGNVDTASFVKIAQAGLKASTQ